MTARRRREAVERLDPSRAGDRFALRDALVLDPDAETRAAAALRLDPAAAAKLAPYLRDAALDASVRVREAAFVALARARDAAGLGVALGAVRGDRAWRVRRAAALFAGGFDGDRALAVLACATSDPFWRVRVAARRAAARLDARVVVGASTAGSGPAPEEAPPWHDEDPAVVVARLVRADCVARPADLLPYLGHPHDALRRFAVARLAAVAEPALLSRAAGWLEDERTPYGPAAVETLLARAGESATQVARQLVSDGHGTPGVLAWAMRHLDRAPEWDTVVAGAQSGDPRLVRACVERAVEAAPSRSALAALLADRLGDDDPATRGLAALGLARLGRDGRSLLLSLPPAEQPTPVHVLLVDIADEAGDVARLEGLSATDHALVRARALAALARAGALSAAARSDAAQDDDPWIRASVLCTATAPQVLSADADGFVRLAAARLVSTPAPPSVVAWARTAHVEADPRLRLRAVELLPADAARDLLVFLRDEHPAVRRAALDTLEAGRAEDALRTLATDPAVDPATRRSALTFLSRGMDEGARDELARVAAVLSQDDPVREHAAMLLCAVEGRPPAIRAAVAAVGVVSAPVTAVAPHADRRTLGRSGLQVTPFGLSGARTLEARDFAAARERGVNLFFWEPPHRELTRFLRTDRGSDRVVVTGTYHADAASIERDAARARAALRVDGVDVLLAFWTRSRARLDEVEPIFSRLRRSGAVRAIGISTHDRALAVEAAERGFDIVMVRHSAAHRAAENVVFPRCAQLGVGVLTFSNLCYGQMLHATRTPLSAPVTAADCYRYSLAQPGVHACIAAPRRPRELAEDLAVVGDPTLGPERMRELRAHGDEVYARSKAWAAETWGVDARTDASPAAALAEAVASEPEGPRGMSDVLSHAVTS